MLWIDSASVGQSRFVDGCTVPSIFWGEYSGGCWHISDALSIRQKTGMRF